MKIDEFGRISGALAGPNLCRRAQEELTLSRTSTSTTGATRRGGGIALGGRIGDRPRDGGRVKCNTRVTKWY
jgi:hypothetical protein